MLLFKVFNYLTYKKFQPILHKVFNFDLLPILNKKTIFSLCIKTQNLSIVKSKKEVSMARIIKSKN